MPVHLSSAGLKDCNLRLKFFTSPYYLLTKGGIALILSLLLSYGISFQACTLASISSSIQLAVAELGRLFSSCFKAVCQILQQLWKIHISIVIDIEGHRVSFHFIPLPSFFWTSRLFWCCNCAGCLISQKLQEIRESSLHWYLCNHTWSSLLCCGTILCKASACNRTSRAVYVAEALLFVKYFNNNELQTYC